MEKLKHALDALKIHEKIILAYTARNDLLFNPDKLGIAIVGILQKKKKDLEEKNKQEKKKDLDEKIETLKDAIDVIIGRLPELKHPLWQKENGPKDSKQVLDTVIALLRYDHLHAIRASGKESGSAKYLEEALVLRL